MASSGNPYHDDKGRFSSGPGGGGGRKSGSRSGSRGMGPPKRTSDARGKKGDEATSRVVSQRNTLFHELATEGRLAAALEEQGVASHIGDMIESNDPALQELVREGRLGAALAEQGVRASLRREIEAYVKSNMRSR